MAHFARVNEENIVEQVLVVPDDQEYRGEEFLAIDLGLGGRWIQTSITNRIRKVFAVPGSQYLPEIDAFKSPKPESNPSFIFDEETWAWIPPVAPPIDRDWAMSVDPVPPIISKELEERDKETGEPTGKIIAVEVFDLPTDPKIYFWNEESLSWIKLEKPSKVE